MLEPGVHKIDGDRFFAVVAVEQHVDKTNPLEAHHKYIDVQVAVEGAFEVLWRPLSTCTNVKKEYDEESDLLFMGDEPTTRMTLEPGVAAVFYPEDAHAPQPPSKHVRKVIFKIAV